MNITFWNNIVQQGEDADMIRDNITLGNLNFVYNDVSLFHYFSDNVEVMEMIHEKFKTAENEDKLN